MRNRGDRAKAEKKKKKEKKRKRKRKRKERIKKRHCDETVVRDAYLDSTSAAGQTPRFGTTLDLLGILSANRAQISKINQQLRSVVPFALP
jgi:hypothetical protein